MAMGHVILKEYHLANKSPYFDEYCRTYTDMPMLVKLVMQDGKLVPDRFLRATQDIALAHARAPEVAVP